MTIASGTDAGVSTSFNVCTCSYLNMRMRCIFIHFPFPGQVPNRRRRSLPTCLRMRLASAAARASPAPAASRTDVPDVRQQTCLCCSTPAAAKVREHATDMCECLVGFGRRFTSIMQAQEPRQRLRISCLCGTEYVASGKAPPSGTRSKFPWPSRSCASQPHKAS